MSALSVQDEQRPVEHVVADSPGTPDSVKEYLRRSLAAFEEGK